MLYSDLGIDHSPPSNAFGDHLVKERATSVDASNDVDEASGEPEPQVLRVLIEFSCRVGLI